MPDDRGKALLTDIGTEELAHVEIISAMLYQLMKGATKDELKRAGLVIILLISKVIWGLNKEQELLMSI